MFQFFVSTDVRYGIGSFETLGSTSRALGASRALIVSDRGLTPTGIASRGLQILEGEGITAVTYQDVEPDPTIEMMDEAAALAVESNCNVVIGIGGGSSMDVAKAAAIVAAGGGSIAGYVGVDKVTTPPLPVIAVPTTAGTGSEVSWHISVRDEARNLKVTVRSAWCMPKVALLDPVLLATVPPGVAAATGMDALAHCLESYTSRGASALTDGIALEAVRLIGENLRPFVADRRNLEAAGNMMVAATLAGMVLSHARTGLCHSMARPLGAHFHIPHGLANALLLARVVQFNAMANPVKFREVARALGERVDGLPTREAAGRASVAVSQLARDIGLPFSLAEVGVKREAIPAMARDTMDVGAKENDPDSHGRGGREAVFPGFPRRRVAGRRCLDPASTGWSHVAGAKFLKCSM